MLTNATSSTHPTYQAMEVDWVKYRDTFDGGRYFIDNYLKRLSVRESDADFTLRKEVSYCPAHAKAAINDIKNAIFQRIVDVRRIGGPVNFLYSADGTDSAGMDLQGNTMNSFIGREILPEMLTMAKVGVFIDKPDVQIKTRADQAVIRPYIYKYRTEDIRNWSFNQNNRLMSLLLRDHTYDIDEFGLPTAEVERYRFCWIDPDTNVVNIQFFDADGKGIDRDGEPNEAPYVLGLTEIPFAFFEISSSLLTDVADYQIALLNLASSDMSYSLKANFPFYTEQYDANTELTHLLRGGQTMDQGDKPGTASDASIAKGSEARVGISQGRRYPKGMERPQFINPSPEPLRVSMEKQDQLKSEIRELINLNIANLDPKRTGGSAESKAYDEHSLESGLSYIALELEYGERRIAQIWAQYESGEATKIKYPEQYTIKSETERCAEADALEKSITTNPSLTYKKAATKFAMIARIGHRVDADTLDAMVKEVDSAPCIATNAETFFLDMENGLVSPELASQMRGYPKGEVEKASKAHAERLARIAIAQSQGAAAARGVGDASANPKEGQEEKKEANDNTKKETPTDATRGKAKGGE